VARGDELSRLQAESDRQRILLLRTDLEACFTFLAVAETEHQTGHYETAERSLADAEKGYATVLRFLSDPKHARHLSPEVCQELRAELERLRTTLDQLRKKWEGGASAPVR
jgi:hypothetical protein